MLRSASQHLTIGSPSSTTISYTVSNAFPRSTRSSQVLFVFGNVIRLLLCLFVLAIDIAKLQSPSYFQGSSIDIIDLESMAIGRLALSIAKSVDWRLVAVGSFLVLYFSLQKGYTGGILSSGWKPKGSC